MCVKARIKILFVLCFLGFSPAWAGSSTIGNVDVSGFIGVESRIFTQNPQFADQDSGAELSAVFQPEFRYKTDDRRWQFSFIPFYRQDSRDESRSHFDVREAYAIYIGDEFEVLAGINKVFWGVTESRHLVNVINQIDGVEDIDGEDYLGQPMINIASQRDWGRVELYVLPYFRERTFAGSDGRFRSSFPVDTKNARFESDDEEKHVDFAARYSHYIGNWDIGLSYFYGTDREAVLRVDPLSPNENGEGRFIPVYNLINQGGLDLQYTYDAWLWKFEGIIREGQGETFTAGVGGFEYTWFQAMNSNADIGFLAEYLWDNRDADAPASAQEDDWFFGARLSLNDIQDTKALAGFTIDLDTGETFYNLEAERRIGNNYDIELRARFFAGADVNDDTAALQQDDYIQIRLSRYF